MDIPLSPVDRVPSFPQIFREVCDSPTAKNQGLKEWSDWPEGEGDRASRRREPVWRESGCADVPPRRAPLLWANMSAKVALTITCLSQNENLSILLL